MAPDPVHSGKQGNYLDRTHLGNSAHRGKVSARLCVISLKLRARAEYAGETFFESKKGVCLKNTAKTRFQVFWETLQVRYIMGVESIFSTLSFWGRSGSSGAFFVVFVWGVDWHALGKRRKGEYCRREPENISFMSFSSVRCEGFLEGRDTESLLLIWVPLGRLVLGSSKLPKWRCWEQYQSLKDCREFLIKYSRNLKSGFQYAIYHEPVLCLS